MPSLLLKSTSYRDEGVFFVTKKPPRRAFRMHIQAYYLVATVVSRSCCNDYDVASIKLLHESGILASMKNKIWSTNKADLEFSHWIRDRDEGKCFFCGKPASQNSHFWGRQISATRYDPLNCDYSCGGCHMRHESVKQGAYRDMKIAQLGKEIYDDMERRARIGTVKRTDAILKCMALINS